MTFFRNTVFPTIFLFLFSFTAAAEEPVDYLHFIDVEEGHAILLDIGDYEILIDGGETREKSGLEDYLSQPGLIDGDLDLYILTQTDTEGFFNFLNIFSTTDSSSAVAPSTISQIWTLGLLEELGDRCKFSERSRYRRLHEDLKTKLPERLVSPIQEHFRPFTETGQLASIDLGDRFPGKVYLVSAGAHEEAHLKGPCSRLRNDASMVIGLEIYGKRILIGGDPLSNFDRQSGEIEHPGREEEILTKISDVEWFRNLDLLVAPRRGSWTANSPEYVRVTAPKTVLFGASKKYGHPGKNTLDEYRTTGAQIYSTAASPKADRHTVVCALSRDTEVRCDYGKPGSKIVEWFGRTANNEPLSFRKLRGMLAKIRRDHRLTERSAFASGEPETTVDLTGFDLFGVDLSGRDLGGLDLTNVDLRFANLSGANLTGAKLRSVQLDYADLSGALLAGGQIENVNATNVLARGIDLTAATIERSNFNQSDFSAAVFDETIFQSIELDKTDIRGAFFEPDNFSLSGNSQAFERIDSIDRIDGLHTLRFTSSPAALQKIKKYFVETGQREKEVDVTYAIEMSKQAGSGSVLAFARKLCCELITEYGRSPNRPLVLLLLGIPIFGLAYGVAVSRSEGAGIFAVQAEGQGPSIVELEKPVRIHHSDFRVVASALYFSFVSAFHFGWRDINVGTWAQRLSPRQFNLDATGWVRVISGVQSMLSFYLVVMWILTFFGNPFR